MSWAGASGFGQSVAPGAAAFPPPQPAAAFGFGQPAQGSTPAGFGFQPQQHASQFDAFGSPSSSFAQQQQQQQQPAAATFGQTAQPPAGSSFAQFGVSAIGQSAAGGFAVFGHQQAPAQLQPAIGGAVFGHQQPAQQQAAAGGFAFGQQPAASPAHQPAASGFLFRQHQQPEDQQPTSSNFTFGQPPTTAQPPAPAGSQTFGQQHAQSQPPAGGYTFGQTQPQQAPGSGATAAGGTGSGVKFSFGSTQRKKQQERPATAFVAEDEGEQMDEAALAAAKAAALASLPRFQGSSSGRAKPAGATVPPPPPPRQKGVRGNNNGGDAAAAEEVARREQRANRFAPPPGTAPVSVAPVAPSPLPFVHQQQRPASAGLSEGEGVGDADADVGGRGDVRVGAIVGTCEEMCPAPERERRARLSDIQIFERTDLANSAQTSAELAVKRFARTIDDSNNAPEYFRTRGALSRTMAYLRDLLNRQDARLGLIHKFLWDRYRSVRQDLYIQGMDDEFSVNIYEEVVRFHVLSEHELCEEEASITEMEGFNSHLNMEQMNKSLISLNEMYNKLAAAGRPAVHEAEFRAYHLLSLMGQHGKFKGDQQGFLSMLQAMRTDLRGSAPIQWVLKLQRAFHANNFVRFFALVRQAPYLLACLSHIYFGQIRGRALRVLGDTLSPKPDMSASVELSWLVDALMLDSVEQAQQLCDMHGYTTSMQEGVPIALLVKGAYVDPPPPVPRKRSELITRLAPATRSLAVITPALSPLSAEEAAQLEQQRQEQLRHFQDVEAQRVQRFAQQQLQEEASAAEAAAVAKKQQQEVEAALLAEQGRVQEQELARQREAQQVEQRRQQEEQRRRQQEAAWQQQQIAELRRQHEEQQRAAAESERLRREVEEAERRRRQAAEEAERLRLAVLERQRLEELLRHEEERKVCRAAKHRSAIQTFYLARWRQEARRRIAERLYQQRLATNLKACRVGMASKAARAEAAVAEELEELHIDGSQAAGDNGRQNTAATAAAAVRTAIDLAALAAPLLLQRSPTARNLYWKLLLAPPALWAVSCGLCEQQQLQHLHSWLLLQLQHGKPIRKLESCSMHVEGPVSLHVPARGGSSSDGMMVAGELTVCVANLSTSGIAGCSSAALAGMSAAVLAVPNSGPGSLDLQRWLPNLSSLTVTLPTLLVTASDAAVQSWQQAVSTGCLSFPGPVLVISVQEAAGDPQHNGATSSRSGSGDGAASGPPGSKPAAYSRKRLTEGLRWLAASAPPQPMLKIVPVDVLARDALAATSMPLLRSPAAAAGGLPAAQLLCAALQQALELVAQAAQRAASSTAAAWHWPPPELAPLPLRGWHDTASLPALRGALQRVQPEPAGLLQMAEGGSLQALRVGAQLQLAALEADKLPPLVLPIEVEAWVGQRLEAAQAAAPPTLPHAVLAAARRQQQPQQQQPGSPSVLQKRKWQAGGWPPAATESAADGGTFTARSWASIVAGGRAAAVPAAAAAALPPPQPAGSAISRLPFWRHFKQQLQTEQQRELGLQETAVLAATGGLATAPPVADSGRNSCSNDRLPTASGAAASKLTLLQQLQQQVQEERTEMDRLVHLALH